MSSLEPRFLGHGVAVTAPSRPGHPLEAALGLLEIGVQQLGLDRLDVGEGVDPPLRVNDVGGLVGTDDVHDRVRLADVGQELVAQTLAAMGSRHQARDVVEVDRVGHDLRRLDRLGHGIEAGVRHRNDGDVGLDRRERVVGRLGRHPGERGEQRGLARVGHPHDADLHRPPTSPIATPSSAPATTSLG